MSRVICDAISMCACSSVIVILMFIPKKGGTIVEPFSWLLHLISFFIQLAQVNQTKIWKGIAFHLRNEGVKQTKAYPSKRWFTTANQETTTITTPYVNKSKLVRLFQAWNLSFPEDSRKTCSKNLHERCSPSNSISCTVHYIYELRYLSCLNAYSVNLRIS